MNIAYYFAYYGGLVLKSRSQAKIDNRSIQGYQPCVCLGYSPSQWCNFSFVIQMLKIDRDPPPSPTSLRRLWSEYSSFHIYTL